MGSISDNVMYVLKVTEKLLTCLCGKSLQKLRIKNNDFFMIPDIGDNNHIYPYLGDAVFVETRTSERVFHN